jgi:hypothetical protein
VIAAPLESLAVLFDQMGEVHEDCSNFEDLPDLDFTLGDGDSSFTFVLTKESYIQKVPMHQLIYPGKEVRRI